MLGPRGFTQGLGSTQEYACAAGPICRNDAHGEIQQALVARERERGKSLGPHSSFVQLRPQANKSLFHKKSLRVPYIGMFVFAFTVSNKAGIGVLA